MYMCMYIYIYIHTYIHTYMYIYIYMYIEREIYREREIDICINISCYYVLLLYGAAELAWGPGEERNGTRARRGRGGAATCYGQFSNFR